MNMKMIAKKFGVASLCLATAISAVSGFSSFKQANASAASTAVAATDLLTASTGATVERKDFTYTTTKDDTVYTKSGLYVSSDVAYEATFNSVFYGSSVFRFRFPETYDSTLGFYGDFKFHVEDVTDPTNCFDIVYYTAASSQTGVYVKWKDQIRTTKSGLVAGDTYTNKLSDVDDTYYSPCFLSKGKSTYGDRLGSMALSWKSGVLSVQVRNLSSSTAAGKAARMKSIARFDGTYDETASKNGFVNKSALGLPKISFPNGYKITISSNLQNDNATPSGLADNATDVVFYDVRTAASVTYVSSGDAWKDCDFTNGYLYSLSDTSITDFSSNYTAAYETVTDSANAGKTLLGWKDSADALYTTKAALASSTNLSAYTPVYLGYDTIDGASVRVESAEGVKSGIRFMSLFDQTEYAAASKYITSFGTLIGWTNTLTKGDFNLLNYASVINAETGKTIAQVQNTKGVFTYKDKNTGTRYTAYSMALVDIADYTREYSARGYIVVTYADGSTNTLYTDYNAEDNARSVAEVAYNLITQDPDAYEAMTDARKAVVDTYAAAYVVPEE